jgi:hypothetical protein
VRRNGILSSEPRGTGRLTMLLGQPLGITTSQRRDCRGRRRHWNSCFIDGIRSADLRNGRMACTRPSLSLSLSLSTATICLFSVETGLLIHVQQVLSLDFAVADTDMLRKNLTLNSELLPPSLQAKQLF